MEGIAPVKLSPARRNDLAMVALGIVVLIVDQLTKSWIVAYFKVPGFKPPIPILGAVLQLDYTQNTGVAFSLLEGQSILFLFIAIAIIVIGYLYWRLRDTGSLLIKLTFGLILGGAIGNLYDRLRQGFVVDFIHFQIPGHFDYPVFNMADSAVCIGVVALAFLLWRGPASYGAAAAPTPGDPSGQSATPPVEGTPGATGPAKAPAASAGTPRAGSSEG
jgi:signal peptidase II